MFEDISDDDINWEIKFDNASREYYSGSMLRGFAKIILNKTIIVRSIYVRVNGIGHIESSRQNHETNIDDKTFINKNIFLEKGESGSNRLEISPGEHEYPFECELPIDLPSSIQANSGYIRYMVYLIIDIPRAQVKISDHPFTVIKQFDLNNNPQLRILKTAEKESTFFYTFPSCTKSEPLDMKVSIPVGGFVPGQTIDVTIETKNNTEEQLYYFCAELRKKIVYNAAIFYQETLCDDECLVEAETSTGVVQLQNRIHKISLIVPPVPPSDFSNSKMFNIQYYIKVTGDVSSGYTDPAIEIPITIGTIPFTDALFPSDLDAIGNLTYPSPIYGLIEPVEPVIASEDDGAIGIGNPPTYEEAWNEN